MLLPTPAAVAEPDPALCNSSSLRSSLLRPLLAPRTGPDRHGIGGGNRLLSYDVTKLSELILLRLAARLEPEQASSGAAQDVVLGLLAQEWQVVNRRGQVEVPVRIVGRVHELRLRIDHLERAFERFEVLHLHGLRCVHAR